MSPTQTPASPETAQIAAITQHVADAWASQDAVAFAAVFTEDGSMVLPGDVHETSRAGIEAYMRRSFAGHYAGTRVTGQPLSIRLVAPDTVVMITRGGVLLAGESEVAPERQITATWVLVRDDGHWRLCAYHNSPSAPA